MAEPPLRVVPLGPDTWDAFDALVEANGGIFGGCWCIGFHPEAGTPGLDHRDAKRERVLTDRAHAALVLDTTGAAVGWAQFGGPAELTRIKHRRAYEADPPPSPDWRLTCVFVGKGHRGQGVARAAVEGAVDLIAAAGGGSVEAIAETTAGRTAVGRFLFSSTVELLESVGFTRLRQVGKHAWIVTATIPRTFEGEPFGRPHPVVTLDRAAPAPTAERASRSSRSPAPRSAPAGRDRWRDRPSPGTPGP